MISEVQRRVLMISGATLAMILAVWLQTRTSIVPVRLAPLPAPVFVRRPHLFDLKVESGKPLFQPTRSNMPIGSPDDAPPLPPPTLTGVVVGGGRAVALVKEANGDTTMLHVGESADKWMVAEIRVRQVVFRRGGEQHTVTLSFDEAAVHKPSPSYSSPRALGVGEKAVD